jgi:hypothetical protein
LAVIDQRIDGSVTALESVIASGAGAGQGQLASAAQQGVASLASVTQGSDELAATTGDGFGASMSAIAGSDNFAGLRTSFAQQVQQTAGGGSAALLQAVEGLRKACDVVTSGAQNALADSAKALEKSCARANRAWSARSPSAPTRPPRGKPRRGNGPWRSCSSSWSS